MLRLLPLLLSLLALGCDSADPEGPPPPPAEPPIEVTYTVEITGSPEFMTVRYRDASGAVVTQRENLTALDVVAFEVDPGDVDVADTVYFVEAEGTLPVGTKAEVSITVVRDGVELAFREDQEFATAALPEVFARAQANLPRN